MSETILRTDGLTRRFGSLVAVNDVDLEIYEGEIRGLIGPNGAGKTTVFNMLSGMLDPSSGEIWFHDEEITDMPPHQITSRGMALAFQITSIFPELTVTENVLGAINGQKRFLNPLERYSDDEAGHERVMELLERVGLMEHAEETAENLSHGDQKVLEMALALASDPDMLLLDEPAAGLSASETRTVVNLLEELHGEVTIMLIEHDMDLVMELVDSLTVLHHGEIISEGKPSEIKTDEQVQEVYFGREY
ncbi:ABC transporter ATP-binding protein [Natronomonas gomsonensis]|jgi:branched-chain amino acid transport system ATP-binding protein|uniref:ABC transporter ATP-binding protein n=1 Tax=Natronomonas gomsonensis TaxID=1046043 RepID=UPI0020CA7177|nr:ABC transporter ATP-binding protein [Natronomonas gomsonensis]MCY4730016.1 ABC transporter ATP-binding protein [Natronomonas gomsonensis]